MSHQIKVTIDKRDGLMANLVCIDHDEAQCGPREVFYWDSANAMEQYWGEPITLAELPIHVLTSDEDEGFSWETEDHPNGSGA